MTRLSIVGIGGGTGLPVLLRGLQPFADGRDSRFAVDVKVSAIVCVTDNGGSSGRLRRSFNIPAVGDLRNCLVALSPDDSVLAELFQHRFSDGNGLAGHALGNLIVTALCQKSGSLGRAAALARQLLPLKGEVLPVTEAPVTLCARLQDQTVVRGECEIGAAGGRIEQVWLEPDRVSPAPGVLEAITHADALVLGPGSLYTSLIPNLLVAGVAEAIGRSRALKIFVCNLMTEPGETDGFSAADHLRTLAAYLGPRPVDFCIVNSRLAPAGRTRVGRGNRGQPVPCDWQEIERLGAMPICADLLSPREEKIRHDPAMLGHIVISLARGALPGFGGFSSNAAA